MAFNCRCGIRERECSYPDCYNGKEDSAKEKIADGPTLGHCKQCLKNEEVYLSEGICIDCWEANKIQMEE